MIGAAVTRPLERPDSRRDRRIDIRPGGGQHTRRKGGVIAAAVLRMEDQAGIEQLCFLVRKGTVGTNRVEDRLRRGMAGIERMKIHTLLVIVAALNLIRIRHNNGQAGNQLDCLAHIIFQRRIVRIVVIGIKREDGAAQLIHNILGRRFDDHVLRKIFRQLAAIIEHAAETLQLRFGGQLSEQKQPRDLLIPEPVFRGAAVYDIHHVDSAVRQAADVGDFLSVVDQIAMYITDQRQTGHHACAVRIAQSAFYLIQVKIFRIDFIIGTELLAKLLHCRRILL